MTDHEKEHKNLACKNPRGCVGASLCAYPVPPRRNVLRLITKQYKKAGNQMPAFFISLIP